MSGLSAGNFKKNLGVQAGEEATQTEEALQEPEVTPDQNQEPAQEPAQEPVQGEEPAETEVNEGGDAEPAEAPEDNTSPEGGEPSGSSLKAENLDEGQETTEQIDDDAVSKYLSEKLGREVTLEELTAEKPDPLESDPYMKEVFEWRKKTGRPIEDFIKYQQDFDKVSDMDVAREFLQLEYPDSTPKELNLELKKFMESEDDLEEDLEQKQWELKKYAIKGRKELDKLKTDLGEPNQSSLSPEIREKVELADKIKSQVETNTKAQEDYFKGIKDTAKSVDKMTLNLGEDNKIDFVVSDQIKKSIPDMIDQMPHWKNEDGGWNHKAVVEDGIKIQNFDKMIQLAFEQGQNSGKDSLIRETKNTNLSDTGSNAQPSKPTNKPIYENEGKKKELKVGFKKRK
jgi:hypothetical protein